MLKNLKFINAVKRTIKENKNRLSVFLPWTIFVGRKEEGIVFLKIGGLMRCYEFIMPDMDSVDADFLARVAESVNNALKKIDENWAVHFECQRSYSNEYPGCSWSNIAGYLIDKRREDNFRNQEAHFVNRYVMTLTKTIKNDIYSKASKYLYKDSNEKGQDYYDWDKLGKEIEQFRGGCIEILSYLSTAIKVRPLDNDECCTFLHSTCSTQGGERKAPLTPQFFDSFITDCDYNAGTTMKVGDFFCPVVSLKLYPNSTYPSMLAALTACNVDLRWVTRFIGMGMEASKRELEKYQKRFYGSQKSWRTAMLEVAADIESNRTDPTASSNESDVEDAMVEQSRDKVTFGYYTCSIMVWDKNLSVAIQKANYIIGIINKSGFGAKLDKFNNFQAWQGMMPGNVQDNLRRPIMSSGNVAQIIPLSTMWQGNLRNRLSETEFSCQAPLLTCGTASGTPFFYNQNVTDVGHGFVFGPTGAGKSTFLCLLESQFLKYKNANVIIFDKDKSARGITMACGGVYLEPGLSDVAFQPLRELETEADLRWCSDFIELLLTEQHLEVDATMRKQILKALRSMAATKGPDSRTITTFQQYITYSNPETGENDIQIALEPYTINGQYGAIFDADKTNISLCKWLMIEMGTLMKMNEPAVTPALMYLFHFIEKIYAKPDGSPKGEPTLLVLDESWVFLDNAFFRKRIEEWLLTMRKFRVFVVFATQEVARVAKSELSTTIISQCPTKIFLADETATDEEIGGYYGRMGLTPSEIRTVANGRKKRDYFYKSTEGVRQFQLELDDFQLALIAPGAKLLDELEAEYGKNTMKPLATEILDAKGFSREYRKYLGGKQGA